MLIYRTGLFLCFAFIISIALTGFVRLYVPKPVKLFDGKTFRGWEGDTVKIWRIEKGAIVGGSLSEKLPHNEFLCTKRSYNNFTLRLKVKLIGNAGFINAGVQVRSQRLTNPAHEMIGYQADMGPKYWGSLYDESRRNKTLVQPDSITITKVLKVNDWNDLEIRCENRHISVFLNNAKTVDYSESDETLPQSGLIGLQIHGGGEAEVSYKDIFLTELP